MRPRSYIYKNVMIVWGWENNNEYPRRELKSIDDCGIVRIRQSIMIYHRCFEGRWWFFRSIHQRVQARISPMNGIDPWIQLLVFPEQCLEEAAVGMQYWIERRTYSSFQSVKMIRARISPRRKMAIRGYERGGIAVSNATRRGAGDDGNEMIIM